MKDAKTTIMCRLCDFSIYNTKELTEKILEFKSLIRGQFKHIYPMISPDDSKNRKEN